MAATAFDANRGVSSYAPFRVTCVLIAMAVAMSGCTVKSFDSNSTSPVPAERIQAVQVAFVDNKTGRMTGKVSIGGFIDLAASKYTQRKADETKEKTRALFDQVFIEGFKEKFPATAANYGLTVSDAAPTELRISVGDQTTHCNLYGCASTFVMEGDLLGSSGKSLWHFKTEIGQSSIFAEIPPLFDKFCVEVLNAMKKDGVI